MAIHQLWLYARNEKIWAGKYKNSRNLLHWHSDCELLYVEDGEIDVFCEGKNYPLKQGQAFFIDGEQIHYMQSKREGTLLDVIVFDDSLVKAFNGECMLRSPLLSGNYDLPKLYAGLRTELTEKKAFYREQASFLLSQFMVNVFRNEETQKREHRPARQNFKNLLREMETKYEFFTLRDGADFMHMNPSYFSRFFHNVAGMPFSKYLNRIKVEKAVQLLKTNPDLPVTEISARCGFYTIRNFNRTFKAMTGYAPQSLPDGYFFVGSVSRPNTSYFNPTLPDCQLIESSDENV